MAAISGVAGNVKINATPDVVIAEIKDWSLDAKAETLGSTKFNNNGWKSSLAGARDWSGSFSGQWDVATDTTGQGALQTAYLTGAAVALMFFVDGTHNYYGNAYIVGFSPKATADGLVELSFDFQGTDALAYT